MHPGRAISCCFTHKISLQGMQLAQRLPLPAKHQAFRPTSLGVIPASAQGLIHYPPAQQTDSFLQPQRACGGLINLFDCRSATWRRPTCSSSSAWESTGAPSFCPCMSPSMTCHPLAIDGCCGNCAKKEARSPSPAAGVGATQP